MYSASIFLLFLWLHFHSVSRCYHIEPLDGNCKSNKVRNIESSDKTRHFLVQYFGGKNFSINFDIVTYV